MIPGASPVAAGAVAAGAGVAPTNVYLVDAYKANDLAAIIRQFAALNDAYKSNDVMLLAKQKFFLTDSTALQTLLTLSGYISLTDAIKAADTVTSSGIFRNSIIDSVKLADLVGVVYRMLGTDGVSLSGTATMQRLQLIGIIDSFLAAGLVSNKLQATYVLAAAFAANDVAAKVIRYTLTDSAKINDLLQTTVAAYQVMIDSIAYADTATMRARFTFLLADAAKYNDLVTTHAILRQVITDEVDFVAALDINDGHFLAWVVNTDTKATWRYSNFGFNSFAQYGDAYLGAMDDGIYVLEGTNDAGADIAMMLRTGVFTFGSASMKRLPMVYMGLARSGDIVLKVIITGEDGIKEAHWYKLDGGPAPSLRQDRVQPDGGLETVTLQFEIINLKGSTIDFDNLHLLPVNLSRRV